MSLADPTPLSKLGTLHGAMLDAVLEGGDLEQLAALAAGEAGGTVAIVVPSAGLAVAWPPRDGTALSGLRRYVIQRIAGEPAPVPDGVVHELPVRTGSATAGLVLLLDGPGGHEAGDVLHLAATSTVVALALDAAPEDRRRAGESLLAEAPAQSHRNAWPRTISKLAASPRWDRGRAARY